MQFICENPTEHCVNSSTQWDVALPAENFEYVTVQPFQGTTLQEDIDAICKFISMQSPLTKWILHPAWSVPWGQFVAEYEAGNPDDMMRPSPEYIADLIAGVEASCGVTLVNAKTNEMVYQMWLDFNNGNPLNGYPWTTWGTTADFTRDFIHMSFAAGRYMMHNRIRLLTNEPFTNDGFNVPANELDYLNQLIINA